VLVAMLALAGASLVALSSPASATTFTVTNSNDSGLGSLRQAFADASADVSGAHIIEVQAGLGPISLTSSELMYDNASFMPLTIHGNGNTVNQTAAGFRAIHIVHGGLFTVDQLTITGATAGGPGAGIDTDGAAVLVTNSTITGNSATGAGGAIFGSSAVTVVNSTISGNSASVFGGGIAAQGVLTLVYTTVASNNAPVASNILLFGTVSDNLSSFGSVVALPQGGGANCGLNQTTTSSQGYNFSDDTSCGFTASTDVENGGDPGLGALADNGGPTPTRLPLTGSPLIDAIPTASCQADGASGITTDQRGFPRPSPAGDPCEIGAVELQPAPVPPPGPPTPPTPPPAPPAAARGIAPRFTG
jgi:predicted outer membrane repeat protein